MQYFPNSLKIFTFENYGEVKVTNEDGKFLDSVYVKAYSKFTDGSIKFLKDGYTDFRGCFSYAETNNTKL